MPKFRKKPVVVEAWQMANNDLWDMEDGDWPDWVQDAVEEDVIFYDPDLETTVIITLEGPHRASMGDWIIKGVKGELYPCKPDIFEMTYEPVRDDHEEKSVEGL